MTSNHVRHMIKMYFLANKGQESLAGSRLQAHPTTHSSDVNFVPLLMCKCKNWLLHLEMWWLW